ncbi:hypothetical protein AtEden1_Chr2g0227651 [Arabidopsis thaliana]
MDSLVSGRHLDSYHASLLGWYNLDLRTWPLEPPRSIVIGFQSLSMTYSNSFH